MGATLATLWTSVMVAMVYGRLTKWDIAHLPSGPSTASISLLHLNIKLGATHSSTPLHLSWTDGFTVK